MLFTQAGRGGMEAIAADPKILGSSVRGVLKNLAKETGNELIEEELTTISQIMVNAAYRVGNNDPKQFKQALVDTFGQTVLTMGAFGAKPLISSGQQDVNAYRSNRSQKALDNFIENHSRNAASKLPEFTKKMAENLGIDTAHYKGRKELATLLQGMRTSAQSKPQKATEVPVSGDIVNQPRKIPSIIDQFEAEQQERLKQRAGGDRRVSIVNHHPVTDMIEGKYANKRLAEIGMDTAISNGIPAVYVEGDLYNLGGLNKKFGNSGADVHFKAMADIAREEFDKLGVEIGYTTKGGDEFGFTVINATQEQVDAVLDEIKPRIVQYVKENGLDNLPHTKEGRNPGTGISFAAKQFDPAQHKDADLWIGDADEALEKVKKKHWRFWK